jgi:hypothetical protein
VINQPLGTERRPREVESVLWMIAAAAWAFVLVRLFGRARKMSAKKRVVNVSDKLLHQVFPQGLPRLGR